MRHAQHLIPRVARTGCSKRARRARRWLAEQQHLDNDAPICRSAQRLYLTLPFIAWDLALTCALLNRAERLMRTQARASAAKHCVHEPGLPRGIVHAMLPRVYPHLTVRQPFACRLLWHLQRSPPAVYLHSADGLGLLAAGSCLPRLVPRQFHRTGAHICATTAKLDLYGEHHGS